MLNDEYMKNFEKTKNDENMMKVVKALQTIDANLTSDYAIKFYNTSVSHNQSCRARNGNYLENVIADFMTKCNIRYKAQVTIDHNGIIIGYGLKKKCHHIVDFVIGNYTIGSSIKQCIVVSCKKSCRERWTQDDWSLMFRPKLYVLVTTSNDYPSSSRFQESHIRQIITCKTKKKDDRIYKLDFSALIPLIKKNEN